MKRLHHRSWLSWPLSYCDAIAATSGGATSALIPTPDRCRVLAAGGMIAVTGGIEIASDELLPKIARGITVKQVIHVLNAFTQAGIMTHAYLIHGFPAKPNRTRSIVSKSCAR